MTDLTPTLDLLVALLERMSIKYVLMGGLVVPAYAIPRDHGRARFLGEN
jgi:hypothetical protein